MDREDLVSICTVTNPTEAEIIRNALQSAGIPAEIGGESQGGFVGVWEINILTHLDDAAKARKYLSQLKRNIRLGRKRRAEAKKAETNPQPSSEAIQELKPDTAIKRRPKPNPDV